MQKYFQGIDFTTFWDNKPYYEKTYVEQSLADEMIALAEEKLGYKLPDDYIEFLKIQNGGSPVDKVWIANDKDGTQAIHLMGFFGIGREKENSIFGEFSNEFWFTQWEYPNIGVIIADTISGGHELIYLDYRDCGKTGEPKVSVVFQESDFRIQVLANNFKEFVVGLKNEKEAYGK